MPREAKLSKTKIGKHTYWSTGSGGKRVYFGNVKEVKRKDAERAFLNHRQKLLDKPSNSPGEITVAQLIDEYLDWSKANLAENNCDTKRSCLGQFANHRVGASGQEQAKRLHGHGKQIAMLAATRIVAGHLADFIGWRKRQPARPGMSPKRLADLKAQLSVDDRPGKVNVNTAKRSALVHRRRPDGQACGVKGLGVNLAKRIIDGRPFASMAQLENALAGDGEPVGPTLLSALTVHIKACWNWGAENGVLPETFRPFAKVPKVKIPKRVKNEGELPTPEEYAAILKWADHDLGRIRGANGRYRQRTPEECRPGKDNPYAGFADLLRFYFAIGPRTSEPATVRVRDVNLRKGQIVLDKHKRSRTQRTSRPRVLTLDAETLEILKRNCRGKSPNDYVFTQNEGAEWNKDSLTRRFAKIRKLAGVREDITLYSFRHLWITDAMEVGVEVGEVADMAGTSIKQIEETYGHVRSTAKTQAQAMVVAHRANRAG